MPSPSRNKEFGKALRQIWNMLRGLEGKKIADIKDELYFEMRERGLLKKVEKRRHSRSPNLDTTGCNTLDFWGKGYVPVDDEIVEFFAEIGVRRAKLSREWLERFLKVADRTELTRKAIIRDLFDHDASTLPVRNVELPSRSTQFLGRRAELEAILTALKSNWTVCLLRGMGGVGKTTLACEVVYACNGKPRGAAVGLEWPRYSFIIWESAENGRLTFNRLLDAIAYRLGYPGYAQKPLEEKQRAIIDILAQQPVLIVIDNVETLADREIPDFIVRLPASTKTLLTSREDEALLSPVYQRFPPAPITIKGLQDDEALMFLRNEIKRRAELEPESKQQITADEDVKSLMKLVEITGGNPKAMELAVGHVCEAAAPLAKVVDQLYSATVSVLDLYDYFFKEAWERCSEDARNLWITIPLFGSTFSLKAIEAASGLQGRYFHDALNDLRGRYLIDIAEIPSGETRYNAHPLVRGFARGKLNENLVYENRARERWSDFYLKYVEDYGDNDLGNGLVYRQQLKEEIENIEEVIKWCSSHSLPKTVRIVERVTTFLLDEGEWKKRVDLCTRALEIARQLNMPQSIAGLLTRLAWNYSEWGQVDLAKEAQDEALAVVKQHELKERLVQLWRDSGYWFATQGNYAEANRRISRSLELAVELGQGFAVAEAKLFRARAAFLNHRYTQAKRDLESLLPEMKMLPREMAIVWRILGNIAIRERQYSKARQYLQNASDHLTSTYYDADEVGDHKESWGDLEKATGNLQFAQDHYSTALELAIRLGKQTEEKRLRDKLQKLKRG